MPIRLGVSRCLLGDAVRYDGGHKRHAVVVDVLGAWAELVPVCPEVEAGLSTPRPPVELVRIGEVVRVRGVHDPELDVTDALDGLYGSVAPRLEGISGFVFKGRSPSCGLAVPVHDLSGARVEVAAGRFARAVLAACPGLPVAEETDLDDPDLLADFVARVRAFAG